MLNPSSLLLAIYWKADLHILQAAVRGIALLVRIRPVHDDVNMGKLSFENKNC